MESKFAEVDGVRLHYLISGKGDPVVLLHGFAETSHMWLPLIAKLADRHTVIAPDLRGFGQSSAPADGYTKAAMAQDIHALVQEPQLRPHPAGRARYRIDGRLCLCGAISRRGRSLVLMEAFLPGVGDWNSVFLLRDLWHFHFYGKTPLALVTGRERIYLEHFWNDFAADPEQIGAGKGPRILREGNMPSPATWPRAWKFSAPSRRTPRISRNLPRPS